MKNKFILTFKDTKGKIRSQEAESKTDLFRCIREMLNDNITSINIQKTP